MAKQCGVSADCTDRNLTDRYNPLFDLGSQRNHESVYYILRPSDKQTQSRHLDHRFASDQY